MKSFLGSLSAVVLLTGCYGPKKKDDRGIEETGPCAGVNGFHEVRGDVVCHHGRILSPNAADFVKLKNGFAVDKKAGIVYSSGYEVEGADPASFETLDGGYARDKARVYYSDKPIPQADRETFEFVGFAFAKDKTHVYDFGTVARNIDAASFTKVPPLVPMRDWNIYEFYKDKGNVYHSSGKISESWNMGIEVDPATFVYYGGPFIQANRRVYFSFNQPIDANPDTFRFLGCSPGKIQDPMNHVFTLTPSQRRIYYCYGQDGERVIEKEY
jgi:hypothetical protein